MLQMGLTERDMFFKDQEEFDVEGLPEATCR